MATNISYATNDTELETLVLHTLPDFGEHGDGIINANLLTAVLKEKGRFIVKEGGLEFWFGLMTSENSNAGFQGKSDDYRVGLQNPEIRLRWDIKVFTDTIAITELDEARNKGRAAIKDFARTLRMQAESTIPNVFNSALWAATPGTNDPDSIPALVSATPTTGTIGGQSRATSVKLQNFTYGTAVASLGSAAGLLVLDSEKLRAMVTASDMPDLAVCSVAKYAGVASYLSTLYRFRPDDTLAKLNIEHVQYNGVTIAPEQAVANVKNGENGITEGYCYLLNTKHLFFNTLADGNFKWGDKFERAALKPVKFLPFKVFCNLCTNLPRAHNLLTSVTA